MIIFGVGLSLAGYWRWRKRRWTAMRYLFFLKACLYYISFYWAIVALLWNRLVLLSSVIHDTPVGVSRHTNSSNGLSYNYAV